MYTFNETKLLAEYYNLEKRLYRDGLSDEDSVRFTELHHIFGDEKYRKQELEKMEQRNVS